MAASGSQAPALNPGVALSPGVVSEGVLLEDAADRAQAKRRHGLVRIPTDKVGFWPGNRGDAGINPSHVHDVAHDIMINKCRLTRYEPVGLLKIPPHLLEEFRTANKEKCDNDPLMPRFSPNMEYVAADHTHFVHALKLGKEGTHTLYNQPGADKVKWHWQDSEANMCMEHGFSAAIYDDSIWGDIQAVEALNAEGNLNSAVDMGEDEMQAFGRIDAIVTRMSQSPAWKDKKIPVGPALDNLKLGCGLGQFDEKSWQHFFNLRESLGVPMVKVLTLCQFNIVGSRVRVKADDFGSVAKLESRLHWIKTSLLLHMYLDSVPAPSQSEGINFGSRRAVFAKSLPQSFMHQMKKESALLVDIEKISSIYSRIT